MKVSGTACSLCVHARAVYVIVSLSDRDDYKFVYRSICLSTFLFGFFCLFIIIFHASFLLFLWIQTAVSNNSTNILSV